MSSFTQILNESKKTYKFKIGVAGDLPEDFANKLETSLKKWDCANISNGKTTPIQKRPLDFPQLQNMEVTYYEAELNYPTTQQVLQEYIGNCCNVNQAYIIVRDLEAPQEEYQEEQSNTYESMLDTEDMGGESAQQDVGTSRVMDLLKELEVARKERGIDGTEGTPTGESADISSDENTTSVIGGQK